MITNEAIAGNLKFMRKSLKLSQAGLAKKLSEMGLKKISRDIIKDSELGRQRTDAVILENVRLLYHKKNGEL